MIRLDCTFFSSCLGRDAHITVLLPDKAVGSGRKTFPVLYLLHGLTDSGSSWLEKTSLIRYADAHSLAVVLPNAVRSFYCDMVYGDAYYTHISQEVPAFCEATLPISSDPADRYIAGNSMGAYGALKIALKEPGRFSKVGLFSGVLDVQQMVDEMPELCRDWLLCFGGNQVSKSEDPLYLMTKADPLPEIYHYCGDGDFLLDGNRTFCRLCRERNIPITSHWEPGGLHEWRFWDRQLPALLDWLDHKERT